MSENELSTKDRIRVELAVRRVDFALDGRVPWRRRRQIRDELRSNLLAAAHEVGAAAAVQQLGNLGDLAESYLELYRGRFDFQTGSYWAIAMYVAIQVVGVAVIVAFHAGLVAGGSQGASFSFELLKGFGPYSGSVSGNGSSFLMTVFSPAHAALMVAAWAMGSSYRSLFKRPARGDGQPAKS